MRCGWCSLVTSWFTSSHSLGNHCSGLKARQGPGQTVCKARYGSTLSNSNGMREGPGGCPDTGCNSTPCLSAGFPPTDLCFRAPALSGVYGLTLSAGPICHVHCAGLMGSSCDTSLQSAPVCPMLLPVAVCCACVQVHPSACGPLCLQEPPKAGGML